MQINDLFIKPLARPDENHQSYQIGARAYFIERDGEGYITLHPVRTYVAHKRTSEMIYIEVQTLGERTPGKEWRNNSRRVFASDLRIGDLIQCPWSPNEDASRFPFFDWEYSPLAAEEIRKCSYPSTPPM